MMTATPRLVVAAEQRGAVGGDDGLALERGQVRVVRDAHHLASDRPAGRCRRRRSWRWTMRLDAWPLVSGEVSTWAIKAMTGASCVNRGGDGGQHDAVLVLGGVGQAHRAQFFHQHPAQFELAGRAGIGASDSRRPGCRCGHSGRSDRAGCSR